MSTTSPSSVAILNNAYSISQTAGRPVAYADTYNHMCARGASAVAASMTNNPALFDTVAANAWASRSKYQNATTDDGKPLYNANQDYPAGGVTSADLANVPPGTVVTFQYGANGHAMTFMGNDPTTGQPQWASDNVNDSPDKFLNRGDLQGVSIITPTATGQAAIAKQCGSLPTGSQAAYTPPPGGVPNITNGVASLAGPNGEGNVFSTGAANQPLTPDQAVTLNSQFFNSLGPGASAPVAPLEALQNKAQNPYSNKQLITPMSITYHVEGTNIDADLLTKSLITNSHNPAKQNSVLAFKRTQASTTNTNTNNNVDPVAKQLKLSNGCQPTNNGSTGLLINN